MVRMHPQSNRTCSTTQEEYGGCYFFFALDPLEVRLSVKMVFSHVFVFDLTSDVTFWPRVLTRALLGLWIFHHLMGGCLNTPRLSRLLRIVEQNGKRRSKAREKSFRNHIGHFFGSGQNWGHQGSKFQNFLKRFLDNKIFNFKGRATILIPSCLPRQGASNHV